MKNKRMEMHINNIQLSVETFLQSLTLAAISDDHTVSREEEITIQKMKKASARYISEILKVKATSKA